MKKLLTLLLLLLCVFGLAGCQKAIPGSAVYSFPEPSGQIKVTFRSPETETSFAVGPEDSGCGDASVLAVVRWFYDLKLTACDLPEGTETAQQYEFYVKGAPAFIYEERGGSTYLIIDESCYKVKNPSDPPIN